jgi:hypothetical protein
VRLVQIAAWHLRSYGRMSWTGSPTPHDAGRFAAAHVTNTENHDLQNRRAARVVAGRSIDARDCAEILAMLGLDARPEDSR